MKKMYGEKSNYLNYKQTKSLLGWQVKYKDSDLIFNEEKHRKGENNVLWKLLICFKDDGRAANTRVVMLWVFFYVSKNHCDNIRNEF